MISTAFGSISLHHQAKQAIAIPIQKDMGEINLGGGGADDDDDGMVLLRMKMTRHVPVIPDDVGTVRHEHPRLDTQTHVISRMSPHWHETANGAISRPLVTKSSVRRLWFLWVLFLLFLLPSSLFIFIGARGSRHLSR